ncbi:hypothetical protein Sru01_50380 [Sphaerisporangium rufum]|uniref:DUF1330 domain-containing protein n=1 Tax=Sphaerisporangium rufum TaxID=1381558 RepID=A0A919R7X4_9ACTN|nr:DUF1330 domain-containing protein [Sphaerisporangium rufum]GII80056.1 hypothetical protein Sru01_50380 [Sphaerisporangium rufum]
MTAYAVAILRDVRLGPPIVEYLEKIDATLAPYGGRFRIHGGPFEVREDGWPGTLIAIEFPDMDRARAWYDSPAYQEILPLRTGNSEGTAILIEGVDDSHKATDVLK